MTKRMQDVLRVLCEAYPKAMTPNEIGYKLGFTTGHLTIGPKCNHAGRTMGPAQRVISALNALRSRELITMTARPDGLSGSAYVATASGWCYGAEHLV